MIVRRLVGLLLVCCCATLSTAQESTGKIKGRISAAGKGIGGVTVRVHQTGAIVFSDADGRFVIDKLPAGSYTLMLTRGQDNMARIVPVAAGETANVEIEVEWVVGGYEKVKVTAVERAGKIVDAPAAVTAVTEEEIEKESSHGQLPKILEYTPGAEVTQSGVYDFNFNTRGFNSSLNRRVSTYIDGRDVGVPLLGAQEWAALTSLDDVVALEFIRGPSAALYGANASSGVIKVTTKPPRDSQGGTLRLTTGDLHTKNADFRWADGLGGGWFYKVVAGLRDTGDFTVPRDPCPAFTGDCPFFVVDRVRPEYTTYCRRVGEVGCLQQEQALLSQNDNQVRFASVRVDRYLANQALLSFETGNTDIEGPVFQTGIGRVQIVDADRPWARVAYSDPHWNVLGHWAVREGDQTNLARALEGRDDKLISDTLRYGVELQTNWNFGGGRGRFVLGAAHTEEEIDTTDPVTGKQTVVFQRIETDRQAVFSQIDWKVSDSLKLVFAGRIDKNTLHDTQFSPKTALVYSVNPKHSFRFTFNEAFQVANYSEFFLSAKLGRFPLRSFARLVCQGAGQPANCTGINENPPIIAVGNDDLTIEETSQIEVGYSAILGRKTFLSVDYYNSRNKNFITDLVPPYGTSLGSPINPDYPIWVGPGTTETDEALPFLDPDDMVGTSPNDISIAQAMRNNVQAVLGKLPFGMRLSQNLDGSTVVVGRTYANVGSVDTQGVDLGLNVFFTDAWSMQFSCSWFDFDIGGNDLDTLDILLPNTPKYKAAISVGYKQPTWDISLSSRWTDAFLWSTGVFQGDVPSYTTTDLAVNWRFSEAMHFGLNIANVEDNVDRQTFGGDLLSRRALTNVSFHW